MRVQIDTQPTKISLSGIKHFKTCYRLLKTAAEKSTFCLNQIKERIAQIYSLVSTCCIYMLTLNTEPPAKVTT